MKYKHIFFDLDRTLWDFEANSKSALTQLFFELELINKIPDFETFHAVYKPINAQYWENYGKGLVSKEELRIGRFADTLNQLGDFSIEISEKLADGYVRVSPYQTKLFPYVKEVLTTLKELNYNLHIITNGFQEVQYIKLENCGIAKYFEVIICSEEVGKNKPHPEIFLEAMKRSGASASNSIMIGDDFNADILGAEKCGIRGILFDPYNRYQERYEIERISQLDQLPLLISKSIE